MRRPENTSGFDRGRCWLRSCSARSFFSVAPPVDRLDVVGMIVSPRSAHTFRTDVIRHNIAVVGEPFIAEGADAILSNDLPVEELPHLAIGAEFPVSAGMARVVNSADTHLALASFQ
jgi:hypothetical protein